MTEQKRTGNGKRKYGNFHAAGPVYSSQNKEQCERLLRSAYTQALELAVENKCGSIDKTSFVVSEKLMGEVASYIDEHYIDTHGFGRSQLLDIEKVSVAEANTAALGELPMTTAPLGSLEALVDNLDEPFSVALELSLSETDDLLKCYLNTTSRCLAVDLSLLKRPYNLLFSLY